MSFKYSEKKSQAVLSVCSGLLFLFLFLNFYRTVPADKPASSVKWVGTWSTAPQLVEPRNIPPEPGLTNNTIRQIVCVSIGGDSLRMKFTNEFGSSPVTMKAVHIAVSADSSAIKSGTDIALSFDGKPGVTMKAGATASSDPFRFPLKPRERIAVTIYFGETSPDVSGHPGSRTTSYIVKGNKVSAINMPGAAKTDHWYIIDGIDVLAPGNAAAVAVLGNSIADGRGSGTNKQDRWPDELAIRLLKNPGTENIAVLNEGIGGNCVLKKCLGPSALSRFNRDILNQSGVRWLIILEGINDIGGSWGKERSEKTANALIAAYQRLIAEAHAKGIKVYGGTLTPFAGSFYDKPGHMEAWKKVNNWIRCSGKFDAVIDFDKALEDPANPMHILPEYDSGDHLHPSEKGHWKMAQAIDLKLFK